MKVSFLRAYNYRIPYQVSLPPLGIGYLSAMIKQECPGVEVTFHHTIDDLLEGRPDVVGLSTPTEEFGNATEMARLAKEYCNAKVLVGGMHITAIPHALPKAFDAACVGEGELTMVELVKLFQAVKDPTPADYAKVGGISFHREKWVQVNPGRELIKDLDTLPYPDRAVLGNEWKVPYSQQVHLISSRGCPYDCSFCSSGLHWKRFRYYSPDYTANEIEYLRSTYNPKEIYFFDDLFIANRKRFRAICEKFEERGLHKGVMFRSYARVDLIDDELADLFEKYNFRFIDFGFESNSQPVLDYFRKRNVTPEVNQRAIDVLSKRHVSVGANIIIGSPPEDDAALDESLKFIRRNRDHIDRFSVGPLFPLPGTPIWTEAKERGLVADDMSDWEKLGFDPDNFDLERYPFMNDHMTREHFYARYQEIHALAREINLIGQLRKLDGMNHWLKAELETIRGSRLVKMAWGIRNKIQSTIDWVSGGKSGNVAFAPARQGGAKKNGHANGANGNGAKREAARTAALAAMKSAPTNGADATERIAVEDASSSSVSSPHPG